MSNPWADGAGGGAAPAGASGAPAGGATAPRLGGTGVRATLENTPIERLAAIMRFVNLVNAVALGISCVFAFQIIKGSVSTFFFAMYLGFFALLLFAFETRIKKTENFIKKLFGFMFTWVGRLIFLIFVTALNFGVLNDNNKGTDGRTVCIIVGVFTLLNSLFNCAVVCIHPAFRNGTADLTDEQVLAYMASHPELAKKAAAQSAGKPGAPQVVTESPYATATAARYAAPAPVPAPAPAPAPAPTTYEPPALPPRGAAASTPTGPPAGGDPFAPPSSSTAPPPLPPRGGGADAEVNPFATGSGFE